MTPHDTPASDAHQDAFFFAAIVDFHSQWSTTVTLKCYDETYDHFQSWPVAPCTNMV